MNQWQDTRPEGCDCVRRYATEDGRERLMAYKADEQSFPSTRSLGKSRWLALPPDSDVEQTMDKPADDLNWRERLEMMVRLAPTVQRMGDYSQGAWPAEIFAAWCCQLADAMIAEARKETT